jgi:hypothetical protein
MFRRNISYISSHFHKDRDRFDRPFPAERARVHDHDHGCSEGHEYEWGLLPVVSFPSSLSFCIVWINF